MRQEEDRDQGDEVDRGADDAGGGGDLHGGRAGKHLGKKSGVQRGRHGADHAAAEVGGEAAAGAAQVHRENARQKLAQKAELGHGQETAEKDSRGEDNVIVVNETKIGQRKQNDAGDEE